MNNNLIFNDLYKIIDLFYLNKKVKLIFNFQFQNNFENQEGGTKFRNLSCLKKILIILSGNQPENIINGLNNNFKLKSKIFFLNFR